MMDLADISNFLGLKNNSIGHVATLGPGAVRGNHWHEGSTEFIIVIEGDCEVVVEFRNQPHEGSLPSAPDEKEVLRISLPAKWLQFPGACRTP
ncbi:MAG: cupin domain-containing protein [Proteobacteria bacterium]|nr:cupin domain-containing protein [Pseudomonadota bacterium]MBU1299230.1 cupin domain-containing protein [Bacteroidota bacterium]MBU1569938.1 cupin domain-containing protein [Pseudomonadota bacterium]